MDGRNTDLTCMAGRFSKSKKECTLFIGDIKGDVIIFNPQTFLIETVITLFGEKNEQQLDGFNNIRGKKRNTKKIV